MRIVLIDYSILTDSELRAICSELSISYDFMVSERDTFSLEKVYIDADSKKLLFYKVIGVDEIISADSIVDVISAIKPYRAYVEEDYDIDLILDKINESGVSSLTEDEKKFLSR